LEVIAGKAVGTSIPVHDELLLGRQFEGPGRLSEDEEISRRHARIAFADASGQLTVEDLGSTNGTFVNGARMSAPRALSVGDTIELGGTTLLVRELPTRGEETALRAADRATVAPGRHSPPPEEQERPDHATTTSLTVSALDERLHSRASTVSDEPASPPAGLGAEELVPPRLSLSLHLEVDFAARSAKVAVGNGEEAMSLVFEKGAWRHHQP
jgi:predicted component of type VI protein secretion system